MANKFFKEIQALRKSVKKLPKSLDEAFTVTQEENETKVFAISDVCHNEFTGEYKLSFVEKCCTDENPLSFEVVLQQEEFENQNIDKNTIIEKEMFVYTTEICPPLVTIGKILNQNVLPERKYFFCDDCVFGKHVSKYKTTTKEQYEEELLTTMIAFKKKVKSI